MKHSILILLLILTSRILAQTNPAITSWIVNYSGQTGFAGIPTNVQQVQYSSNNVYISTNSIADYTPIGYDWPNNPWFPEAQNFVFKITLNPLEKPINKTNTPYGHIGIWTNGVSIYNPKDAKSWQDSAVWFQNALYFEHIHLQTFDECFGHPNNMHEYHTHVNPTCLYDDTDSTVHAPIIGYAFDGFPIYGAYAYTNPDGSGPIKRMRSSYRLRNITSRTTLPDGTALPPSKYGPTLLNYALGAYIEDHEYVAGLGDLDQYNGRFCQTPEYPDGIYAYFVTINEDLFPVYPYVLGPKYFGIVQPGNTGPNSGHNIINEAVTVYTSVNEAENLILFEAYPNPVSTQLNLFIQPSFKQNMSAALLNSMGQVVAAQENIQTGVQYSFETSNLPSGIYVLLVQEKGHNSTKKIIIQH
jgi:hypothetical protein